MTSADRQFYTYCGTDCMVTYECNQVMDSRLMPGQRRHYQFNLSLLPAILYMELRGIRYDHEKAKAKLKRVQKWAWVLQDMLNRAAGCALPCDDTALVALVRSSLCLAKPRRVREWDETKTYKNGKTKVVHKRVSEPAEITTLADCAEFALPSKKSEMRRVQAVLKRGRITRALAGELSVLLQTHVKVNSTGGEGDAVQFLYETCGFPKQFQKEGNRLTEKLSSDDEALIKIWVAEQKKPAAWEGSGVRLKSRGRLALAFLKLRRLITQTKTLRVAPDADGRMRCGYNLVGTETARLACYESPTGSGYNLQTVTKSHRDLFMADEGCLLAQCDLAGADGWTVAAYAAAQGDRTMLEDYKAKLKPAKITALMQNEGLAINRLSREQIKERSKEVDQDGWLYFAHKQVVYGSSYGMGGLTMSDGILTKSFKLMGKPIYVPAKTCEMIQKQCFYGRYWGIPRWQKWMEAEIKRTGCLIASNGFKRLFFGRKDNYNTVKQALAHLPQVYTTASTMMALEKLWYAQENRQPDGSLRVEPLHTVHDSLLTGFLVADKEWAVSKLRAWFDNPMLIAQEMLVIPFEGAMGRDWKHLDAGTI
jgi:hypothetical protein